MSAGRCAKFGMKSASFVDVQRVKSLSHAKVALLHSNRLPAVGESGRHRFLFTDVTPKVR